MEKKTGHILSAVVVAAAIGGLFWQNAGLQDKVDQLSQQVSSLSNQLVDTRYDLSDDIDTLRPAAIGGLFWQNAGLQDKVDQLSQQVSSLSNQLVDTRYDLSDDIDTLRRDMDEENSLFSSVETGLGYIGGDLSLSVSLVPKELSVGETAQLSLSTGETAVLTDNGSGRLTGVLTCPLRESLEPVVILTDGETTRREVLPTLWTNELFTVWGDCNWEKDEDGRSDLLRLEVDTPDAADLRLRREVLPTLWTNELFTVWGDCNWEKDEDGRSDLLRLEVDTPDAADLRLQTLTVEVRSSVLDPAAPGSLVGSVAAVRGSDGSWTANLTQYLYKEEEYDYDFWLTAAAEGGLTLRSEQPVADCQQNGQGGSCGSGSFTLIPDLS